MYALYCRLENSREWWAQETTKSKEDAEYWLKRNRERETGRVYVLVKKVTTFEVIDGADSEAPDSPNGAHERDDEAKRSQENRL